MTSRYTVERGESAQDVARKFTGDPSRYRDLIPMNPHLQTVIGTLGAPEFHPHDWHDGMSLKIPERWVVESGSVGAPRRGLIGKPGDPCSVGAITDVKPYYYKVADGDYPEKIAKTWLGSAWSTGTGPHTTMALLKANHDKPGGFIQYTYGCNFKYFNAGDIIKIPASWPNPPTGYSNRIVAASGAKYIGLMQSGPSVSAKSLATHIKTPWDMKHPQWPGWTNLSYWSERIFAFIKSQARDTSDLTVDGVPTYSGNAENRRKYISAYNGGVGKVGTWLKSNWATPNGFLERFSEELSGIPASLSENITFANPIDKEICSIASQVYVSQYRPKLASPLG